MSDLIAFAEALDTAKRDPSEAQTRGLTFSVLTGHPSLFCPDYLKKEHDPFIVLVLQHWFKDLHLDTVGFSVTLLFSGKEHNLYIPWASVIEWHWEKEKPKSFDDFLKQTGPIEL